MMGRHDRSEALFYYFRLEDQVPENHLLRLIEKHISFTFVRERLQDSYSETGRPSIDPELLLRILLIGYLYGITSERKLVEELRMHLRRIRRTGTESSCNGWRIGTSLPTCERATVSTGRTARSTARSGSRISRKATAISAPQVSHSTTAAGVIATAPIPTSELANVVGHARKGRSAPVRPSAVLPSTCMNLPGNVRASWRKHQPSRAHSGNGKKWKPSSRN
jgi:Transposase domain (DUF772)